MQAPTQGGHSAGHRYSSRPDDELMLDDGYTASFDRPQSEMIYTVHDTDAGPVGFDEQKVSCSERVLSIGGVVGMQSFVSVALSVIIGVLLLAVSFNAALDDTQTQGDVATKQCYDTANEMVQNTMQEMMRPGIAASAGEILMFLDGAINIADRISVNYEALAGEPKDTSAFTDAMAPTLWTEMAVAGRAIPGNNKAFAARGCGLYHGPFGASEFVVVYPGGSQIWMLQTYNASYATAGPAADYTGIAKSQRMLNSRGEMTQYPFPVNFGPSTLGSVQLLRAYRDEIPVGDMRWGALESISTFVGYVLAAQLADPTNTYPNAEAIVFVDLNGVRTLFQELVEQSCENFLRDGVCPPMRMFSTIRRSWVAEMKQRRGEVDWRAFDQNGLLTGVSHGEASYRYIGRDSFVGRVGVIESPNRDTNASDPVIRAAATYIHADAGGYEQVLSGPSKGFLIAQLPIDMAAYLDFVNTTAAVGDDTDTVWMNISGDVGATTEFVMVLDNVTDPRGLDWTLTFISPTQPLLEEVARIRIEQEQKSEEEKKALERRVVRERTRAYIGVTVLCVFCAVLATLITQHLCVKPIQRMQVAMQDVAGMDLDAADHAVSSTSFMSDIRQMQNDFNTMIENLREYRAYVPASLLEANGKTKKTREPPEGIVAIMFTDIKGSTALWKECPVGMNAALETHNETIRSLYDRYDAYEVKTIGDSFMISFSDPLLAVKMGTQIQQALAKQDWPSSLSFPDAGMVIRIGINYGPVVTEHNPMTGRVDYRGSTVNCAARVEAKALGGCTCVTKAVMDAVAGKLGGAGIHTASLGMHELRGLGDQHELWWVVPAGQKHRFKEDTSDCFSYKLRPVRSLSSGFRGSANGGGYGSGGPIDAVEVRSGAQMSELSGATSFFDASGMIKGNRRTQLQLSRGSCTVAVCKLMTQATEHYFDHCNLMVRAASEAALATDGTVGHVGGRTLTIFWNASKRCRAHPTAALMFAAMMEPRTGGVLRVGLASGQMLHGNVGTQKQRFATTIGMPLEAAQLLVDYAQKLGEFCLAADCTMESRMFGDSTLYHCLRLFDVWEEVCTMRQIHIFQVLFARLQDTINNGHDTQEYSGDLDLSDMDKVPPKPPTVQHSEWVRTVLREGRRSPEGSAALLELDALATANPGDRMLKVILDQLMNNDPIRGCRGAVSLHHLPHITQIDAASIAPSPSEEKIKEGRAPSVMRLPSGPGPVRGGTQRLGWTAEPGA